MPRVTVLSLRPLTGAGNLHAYADVEIDGRFVIRSCRVIQQPGQRAYVSGPQEQRDGRYWPLVIFRDPALKEAVCRAVLDAWEAQSLEY
jgi:DNA-binding cell septation regulator SpoVG